VAVRDSESRSAVAVAVLLGFAAAFVVALLEFRSSDIIARFAIRWELARAASLLAAWMPPLLFAACAASMSLHREQGLRFAELLRPVLVPALILALLFSALELTVLPGVRRAQTVYESLSTLFRDALADAETALGDGDLARAQERASLAGAIDSTETAYKLLNEKVQRAVLRARQSEDTSPRKTEAPPAPPDDGASAYEFYQRALAFYRRGDFYSAHWYAGKSLILDPSRRDARKLQADAWERITTPPENPADKARAAFHERKAEAYALLQSEAYLEAYRAFTDLNREDPGDADVVRYRKESLDRLAQTAFFGEDFRRAFAGQSREGLAVRVVSEGVDHVLYASRVAVAGPFLYLEEFEYMTVGENGPVLHVQAPYARLRGLPAAGSEPPGKEAPPPASAVSLRMVERGSPRQASRPRFLKGSMVPPDSTVLVLPMDFEALSILLDLQDQAERIPFFRLAAGARIAPAYGIDPSPYRMETALRISIPVMLMTLVLLGTALGARFRRDEEPGRLRMMLTLPLLTALASIPMAAAGRAGQYLLGRLFADLPSTGALAVWAGFLVSLLALSFLAVGRLGVHAPD